MAALTLTGPQSTIIAAMDALLDQALQFGVVNNLSVQIVPPMQGYTNLTSQQKQATRNIFLASIAAALAAGVT
jgi:hypothetical protein